MGKHGKMEGRIMFRIWDIDRHEMLDDKYVVFNDGKFYFDYRDFENGIALLNIVVMQNMEQTKKK